MLVHALLDAIVVVRADVAIHVHHVARYARHRVLTRVVILVLVHATLNVRRVEDNALPHVIVELVLEDAEWLVLVLATIVAIAGVTVAMVVV